MQTLLVATQNQGKIAEYRLLLSDVSLAITSLVERGIDFQAPETGSSFAENACQKATTFAEMTGLWTWADDSGLEVDALNGRPGIYSARYGGGKSDTERVKILLDELADTPDTTRTARFRCAVCIARPDGQTTVVEDSVEGMIISEPKGDHGFGYDPIFFIREYDMTMAELPAEVKNRISHRGKAARTAKRILSELLGGRPSTSSY